MVLQGFELSEKNGLSDTWSAGWNRGGRGQREVERCIGSIARPDPRQGQIGGATDAMLQSVCGSSCRADPVATIQPKTYRCRCPAMGAA